MNKIQQALMIAGTTVGVYLAFRYLLPFVFPFIFAYFLVKLVMPFGLYAEKKYHIPSFIGGSAFLFVLVGGIGVSIWYLGKMLLQQLITLFSKIPYYQSILMNQIENFCKECDRFFRLSSGSMIQMVNENVDSMVKSIGMDMVPELTKGTFSLIGSLSVGVGVAFIIIMASLLIMKDYNKLKMEYESSQFYETIHKISEKLAGAGFAYLKAQGILLIVTGICLVIALLIIGNPYALLAGMGIAIFDAFPVLGSGLILVPWAIIKVLSGNLFYAAVLVTAYFICQLIRELWEPHLLGNQIGIWPIYTLMSMYVGVKTFSIVGFILGPIGLVFIKTIVQQIKAANQQKKDANSKIIC